MFSYNALFLDRDGVLTPERGYITSPDDLELLPGVGEAVAAWNAVGVSVFVYTNQSGVGRGYLTLHTLERIHDRLRELLAQKGATLMEIYACPHISEDECDCRKPLPGMLHRASREHGVDLSLSLAVGDTPRDLIAGKEAGCEVALVLSGHTKVYRADTFAAPPPDLSAPDLAQLTEFLLSK